MANWKEIQGRIRRAQKSEDPAVPLAALYETTHDAMVAFELARHLEQAGDASGAGRWYVTAAQGFRRPLWKAKAEEALTRLGVALPEAAAATAIPSEARIPETQSNIEFPEITEGSESAERVEAAEAAPSPAGETAEADPSGHSIRKRHCPSPARR